MPHNNAIKKLLVTKIASLKRKAEFPLDNHVAKKIVCCKKTSTRSTESWVEFLLKCTVDELERLAEEVQHLKQEITELKRKQVDENSDSAASADGDDEEDDEYVDSDGK
ncbi:hypothetical protein L6164_025998 [Bauhinia variegata]|nr:hypothetical protein L6164_025998 [Bauhinia variegata]